MQIQQKQQIQQIIEPIVQQHVAETMASAARCAVGKAIEPAARAIRETTEKMANGNQGPMRYCYTSSRRVARVGGRPDAVSHDATTGAPSNIVEHKCRMRGLFYSVPVYERVQLHAYMAMLRLRSAELCETFRGQQERHTIAFDDELWTEVTARLDCVADMALELMANQNTLEEYASNPDKFILNRIPWY